MVNLIAHTHRPVIDRIPALADELSEARPPHEPGQCAGLQHLPGGSGDNQLHGLAVDGAGNAFLTGYTATSGTALPTKNPVQGSAAGGHDVFLSELNPWQSGSASLLFSTYLGGNTQDAGEA
jgi:hypothetical protein